MQVIKLILTIFIFRHHRPRIRCRGYVEPVPDHARNIFEHAHGVVRVSINVEFAKDCTEIDAVLKILGEEKDQILFDMCAYDPAPQLRFPSVWHTRSETHTPFPRNSHLSFQSVPTKDLWPSPRFPDGSRHHQGPIQTRTCCLGARRG